MKLIIEIDLEHMPMLPEVMMTLNQGLVQAVEKNAVPLDLSEIAREKFRWIESKNVGLVLEMANPENMKIIGRVGVTDSSFDSESWADALVKSDPQRYAICTNQP